MSRGWFENRCRLELGEPLTADEVDDLLQGIAFPCLRGSFSTRTTKDVEHRHRHHVLFVDGTAVASLGNGSMSMLGLLAKNGHMTAERTDEGTTTWTRIFSDSV